jgi:hypothetical protein
MARPIKNVEVNTNAMIRQLATIHTRLENIENILIQNHKESITALNNIAESIISVTDKIVEERKRTTTIIKGREDKRFPSQGGYC